MIDSTIPTHATQLPSVTFALKGANDPGALPEQLSVVLANLANVPDTCAFSSTTGDIAKLLTLVLLVGSNANPSVPVGPGKYPIGDPLAAVIVDDDANCNTTNNLVATSGFVQLDQVEPTLEGAFDLTFPTGRTVGSFNAPMCATQAGPAQASGGPTCRQLPPCSLPSPKASDGVCFPSAG